MCQFKFQVNVLNYYTIRSLVKKFLDKHCKGTSYEIVRPLIPHHMKVLIGGGTGSKPIYRMLQYNCMSTPNNEMKWNLDLSPGINDNFWKLVYKICFHAIQDNSFIWFQCRILHRIIGVQYFLNKVKITQIDRCRLCQQHTETITHLFADCAIVNILWDNVKSWINTSINFKLNITKTMKILGYLEPSPEFWPLNFVLFVTRYSIFSRAKDSGQLNKHYNVPTML